MRMVKIMYYLCAIIWSVFFILFCAGVYEPDAFTIGLSFFFSAITFLFSGLEAK